MCLYIKDALFNYSVSITGTEESIFSLFSYVEYTQISFNVTEVCFVLQLNKKCMYLRLPL